MIVFHILLINYFLIYGGLEIGFFGWGGALGLPSLVDGLLGSWCGAFGSFRVKALYTCLNMGKIP